MNSPVQQHNPQVHFRRGLRKAVGLYGVYVVTTEEKKPSKIGMADDIATRLIGLQVGHWVKLSLADHWWLAGKPLAQRVEAAALERMKSAGCHIRGEWFDAKSGDCARAIEAALREMGLPFLKEWELCKAENKLTEIERAQAGYSTIDFDFEAQRFLIYPRR